jgi:redox-sensitive bicupin YhaK (pirin superfamily)
MKINIHKNEERGSHDYGWLKSKHCFSFGDYFNPVREDFGVVRVLNDEIIEPDSYFSPHHQKNLEVILLPLRGSLAYRSENGFKATVGIDEVLAVSTGSGIDHSFGNPSLDEKLELIQIWIYSRIKGIEPRIQMLLFPTAERNNKLQIIAEPNYISDVLWINQEVRISRINLSPDSALIYKVNDPANQLLIFILNGNVRFSNLETEIKSRDTIEVTEIREDIRIIAAQPSDLLIIESIPD